MFDINITLKQSPSKNFLIGPSGSGKTHFCVKIFKEHLAKDQQRVHKRAFFIVPNKEHADRLLSQLSWDSNLVVQQPGYIRPPILTLQDFLIKSGLEKASFEPGDYSCLTMMREAMERKGREYFADQIYSEGTVRAMLRLCQELKASLFTPALFAKRVHETHSENKQWKKKWMIYSNIYTEYSLLFSAKNYSDTQDLLQRFCNQEDLTRHAQKDIQLIILDGFYHFTPLQMQVIKRLSALSRQTLITLTKDSDQERDEFFYFVGKTEQELLSMGFMRQEAEKRNHRARSQCLSKLEQGLFRYAVKGNIESAPEMKIFEAVERSGEVEKIAKQIMRMRRKGYRYSDICILIRKIGPYQKLIQQVFAKFDIPSEINEREKVCENPLIRAFLSWIDLLLTDWSSDAFAKVLLNSYFGAEREKVQGLLNRSSEGDQSFARWKEIYPECLEDEQSILKVLLQAQEYLVLAPTATERSAILIQQVQTFGFLIRPWCGEDEVRGYRALQEACEEVTFSYKNRESSGEDLSEYLLSLKSVLNAALYSVKVRDKNRVQVYDIPFALQKEFNVVFIAGLEDASFPGLILQDPLLSDQERKVLSDDDYFLVPRSHRYEGENYFFYMAATRARDHLYLSYARYQVDGRENSASVFLKEIRRLVPNIECETDRAGAWFTEARNMTRQDLPKMLAGGMAGYSSRMASMIESVTKAAQNEDWYEGLIRDLTEKKRPRHLKDPEILERLVAKTRFRATELRTRAICSFRHFVENQLNLKEDEESLYLEKGILFHEILEKTFIELQKYPRYWEEEKKEKAFAILEKHFTLTCKELKSFATQKNYRQHILLEESRDILRQFLAAELSRLYERPYQPAGYEVSFGGQGTYAGLKIMAGKDLCEVVGKIDRLDRSGKKVSVVDYKLGQASALDFVDRVERGLELQIPLYLLAARELFKLDPVAGELLPVTKPEKRAGLFSQEDLNELDAGTRRRKGVVSKESLNGLLEKAKEWAGEEMVKARSGLIALDSKTCAGCKADSICRFEKWKLIYERDVVKWSGA